MNDISTPWPDDAIEVAVVTGGWGVKGALRVKPHSADPQALHATKRWFWRPSEGMAPAVLDRLKVLEQPLRIASARDQGDAIVAQVHDLDDRDLADACKGLRLFVRRSSFPTADEDEYYWVDLIGLRVINRDGIELGKVVGLLQTGPHCVLRIESPPEQPEHPERLIPFVGVYIDDVDRSAGLIRVDWDPED